jgi:Hint domain
MNDTSIISSGWITQRTDRTSSLRLGGMAAGTRLLTPNGYRPIETLRRGDRVATLIGRGPLFVPIEWIGRRQAAARHAAGDAMPPVRIGRNAIGDNMPNRDILLASDHAVYIDGTLYRACDLVNSLSIRRARVSRNLEYWCVRLERHDLVVAENLSVESALNAAAFIEVTAPALRLVDADPSPAESEPAAAINEFAARMQWSTRWFRRRLLARGQPAAQPAPQTVQLGRALSESASLLNVQDEGRTILAGLTELAARKQVQLEIAVQPDLTVHIASRSFHEILDILLIHAIESTPGGHVLLGGMRHGGRVQIAVIDDGRGVNADVQRSELCSVEQAIALLGGRMEIDSRPNEGTTILLRLPDPPLR